MPKIYVTAVCNVYKRKNKTKIPSSVNIKSKIIYDQFIFSCTNVQKDNKSINQSII